MEQKGRREDMHTYAEDLAETLLADLWRWKLMRKRTGKNKDHINLHLDHIDKKVIDERPQEYLKQLKLLRTLM